ncbi:MAG: DNRLRE domain-containing protein [Planctomycetes bacterium]|nr:DNRLRE domain-containing protein [Planctomycetota bacterium]MCC7396890.1 DNRLRE domain-containing protein [Planctomycetota bacterium]
MRLTLLPLLLLTAPALAQITAAVPCVADNTLYQDALGNTSNGSGGSIFAGTTATGAVRRAVLRFDVAGALPAGATIVSATLSLHVLQTMAPAPVPASGHRVLQAWGEGASVAPGNGGGGTLAATGDATWLHTSYSTSFWTTPGGSFVATPSFPLELPNTGFATVTAPGLAADVQLFLDNPTQNFGWIIKTDEVQPATAHRMDSREGATKPTLVVRYLLPGNNGTWGTGCPVGTGNFTNSFVGTPTGGTTIQITQSGAPAIAVGTTFYSLDLDPVGIIILPGCTVHLPLNGMLPGGIYVTNAAGAATSPFPVPSGFPGHLVVAQSIVLTNNALGFVVSDAALTCLQ